MEWVFKWLKILLLVALCILMIAIRAGGKCSDLLCRQNALTNDLIAGSGGVDSSTLSIPISLHYLTILHQILR